MNKNNITINDLARIRKIINLIINILEKNINDFSKNNIISEENKELIGFLIGNKDNVVSIVTKLTNLLTKVIPLEEKMGINNTIQDEKLTNDDTEMIKRYIEKTILLSKS